MSFESNSPRKYKKVENSHHPKKGPKYGNERQREQREFREVVCADFNRSICAKDGHHMKQNIRWLHICKICKDPSHPEFHCPWPMKTLSTIIFMNQRKKIGKGGIVQGINLIGPSGFFSKRTKITTRSQKTKLLRLWGR